MNIGFLFNDMYVNTTESLLNMIRVDDSVHVKSYAIDRLRLDGSIVMDSEDLQNRIVMQRRDLNFVDAKEIYENPPDYLFVSSPYDDYSPIEFRSRNLCRITKLMHISYGTSLYEWSGKLEFLAHNPFLANAYRIFVESRYLYPGSPKFVPVGITKLDRYLDEPGSVKARDRFHIVWKPRWALENLEELRSQISIMDDIVRSKNAQLTLIEHPMLWENIMQRDNRLFHQFREFLRSEHVEIDGSPDFLSSVLSGDVFVGGLSSTAAEFLWTGRPMILDHPDAEPNRIGREILNMSYVVKTGSDLKAALKDVASQRSKPRVSTPEVFRRYFDCGYSRAAKGIMRFLKEDFAMERAIAKW